MINLDTLQQADLVGADLDKRVIAIARLVAQDALRGFTVSAAQPNEFDLEWILDGGGVAIVTQTRQVVFDFAVTITGATLVGPPPPAAAGILTVVIRQYPWDNYSVTGQITMSPATAVGGAPALPAGDPWGNTRQFRDMVLDRWSALTIPAGDILELAVTQATVFRNAVLVLRMVRG